MRYKKKRINLGHFINKREAATAYNEKALELFGEFASLNDLSNKALNQER